MPTTDMTALEQIKADQAAGKMPNRPLRLLHQAPGAAASGDRSLRQSAELPTEASLGTAFVEAMKAIEAEFEPLWG